MGDIALTATKIATVVPLNSEIYTFIAGEAVTVGQAICIDPSTGKGILAGDSASLLQFRGVALNGGGIGQAISVLKRGMCYGFTVSGMAYDDLVYLSATSGNLATSGSVFCGRIVALSDPSLTKVMYVDADWLRTQV